MVVIIIRKFYEENAQNQYNRIQACTSGIKYIRFERKISGLGMYGLKKFKWFIRQNNFSW